MNVSNVGAVTCKQYFFSTIFLPSLPIFFLSVVSYNKVSSLCIHSFSDLARNPFTPCVIPSCLAKQSYTVPASDTPIKTKRT